ncbi:MAG: hypothetical protein PUI80_04780 [Peptoniphilaceae bacterium]|nr:hypothetical protein [Peptoniphilaceae bacterium]
MDYYLEIRKGELSPLASFANYMEMYEKASEKLIGLTTPDGVVIKEISNHFLARVFGNGELRDAGKVKKYPLFKIRKGVALENIEEALKKPKMKIPHTVKGEHRITYTDSICSVTVSVKDGRLIQTNLTK